MRSGDTGVPLSTAHPGFADQAQTRMGALELNAARAKGFSCRSFTPLFSHSSISRARAQFAPPALQAVSRDFAFLVPADLPAENLVRAIRGAGKQAITAARIFDRFESAGGLSLAVEVTLQPGEKSFTEDELAAISATIVAAAEKLGARLRG